MTEKFILDSMAKLKYIDINIIPIVKNYIYETKTHLKRDNNKNIILTKYRTRYGVIEGIYKQYQISKQELPSTEKYNKCLLERCNYINGKIEGKRERYYLSGKLLEEENFKQGKRNGIFKRFDEEGNLMFQHQYNDGVLDGESLWLYPNGKIKEMNIYKQGTIEETKLYWENGQLHKVLGNNDGEIKEWYDNGNIMSITVYDKGEIIDEKRFHKDERHMEKVGNVMWL